jgi:flagellar hook-associated protein 1 FlgK
MSLNGALSIGQTALAASQASLQVISNNVANVANPNYADESAQISSNPDQQLGPNLFVGTGVDLTSVQRQVDEALNSRLNSSISDNQSANVTQQWSGQIQSVFNALGSNSLDSQFNTFMNDWSQLANSPTDTSQRQVVVQDGQALAQQLNNLDTQLGTMQTQVGTQLTDLATNATQLAQQIAGLNQQIANSGGDDNSLLDQRDAAVQSLSQLVNIQTVNQGNGTVNVYIGSDPLVLGTSADGINVQTQTVNGEPSYSLTFASNGGTVSATSGQLGATLGVQSQLNGVIGQLNSLAGGLIFGLNSIYASGQGTAGFTSVTGTNQVLDPTAALNSTAAGLAFQPVNGSFVVTVTNTQTGLASSTLVPVNLTGTGSDTSLNSLAASLSAIPNVSATVTGGELNISTTSPDEQITFSQDSSHVLAALGINTFFQGSTAASIAVNPVVANNTQYLNAAQDGQPGDNQTALAIAQLGSTPQASLGGQSWLDSYNSMINGMATTAQQASNNATSTLDIVNTLQAQQQSVSGVSIDNQTISMMQQQRAFQGAAELISTINTMMTSLMDITL